MFQLFVDIWLVSACRLTSLLDDSHTQSLKPGGPGPQPLYGEIGCRDVRSLGCRDVGFRA